MLDPALIEFHHFDPEARSPVLPCVADRAMAREGAVPQSERPLTLRVSGGHGRDRAWNRVAFGGL